MFGTKKIKEIKYSDLSSRDQKKIFVKSIRAANKEQSDLVERFDKKFSSLKGAKI